MSNPNAVAIVAKKLGAQVNPIQLIETLITTADNWVTEVQQGQTARAEIAAWRQVQTDKIRAQQAVLLKALELTFDERRENFRRMFDGLDSAMQSGDASQAAAVLEAITDLAKVSPFKELANVEIVVADLKRDGHTWTL